MPQKVWRGRILARTLVRTGCKPCYRPCSPAGPRPPGAALYTLFLLSTERFTMRYLHTMLRVRDLDAALHFFCDQLGLVEIRRSPSEKGRYTNVFLAAPQDKSLVEASLA